MKNLNKFLLIVAFATINYQSFAQTYSVKAGINIANSINKSQDMGVYTEMILGVNLGCAVEFKIGDAYSVETGLVFNNKGLGIPTAGGTDTISKLGYIDIPINIKYKFGKK